MNRDEHLMMVEAISRIEEHIKLTNGMREKVIKRLDYLERMVYVIMALITGNAALSYFM